MHQERLKPLVDRALAFHVKNAPGLIMGVYMVDLALELLDGIYPDRSSYTLNAICETRVCLPDAIQVLTGCTYGNKYLRLDAAGNGRYALVLYNRETAVGFRVFVDVAKIDPGEFPELHAFFKKTRDYSKKPRQQFSSDTISEFYRAGRSIFSCRKVKVNLPSKDPLEPASICTSCGESYLIPPRAATMREDGKCPYCVSLSSGAAPFEILE